MLNHSIRERRPIPLLGRAVMLLAGSLTLVFTFMALPSIAQDDVKFREFDRDMVHSPRELARDLNYLFFKDKKNPLADLDPEKVDKLRELGKSFVENLSEEERQQAKEFAEKFMHDKGLNSHEGKLLMDQLGVSPEMQSELAKEFGDKDPADFERFRDLFKDNFKNNKEEAGSRIKASPNSSSRKGGAGSGESRAGTPEPRQPGRPGQRRSSNQDERGKANSNELPKDLFERLPNELRGKSADGISKQRNAESKAASNPQRGSGAGDAQQANRDKSNSPGDQAGKSESESASKIPRRVKGSADAQSQGGLSNGDPESAAKGLADKNKKAELEDLQKLLKQLESRGKDDDPFADLKNKKPAGEKTTGRPTKGGSKVGVKKGDGSGGSNQAVDETFKSWIQMEAIKEGIRRFQKGEGPSEFQRRSLESAFKKGFKGIGDSLGEGAQEGLSKSKFKDKMDRVLFKAAKKSVQPDGEADSDSDGNGVSVESAFGGLLDRVSDAAKNRQEQRRKRELEGWKQSSAGSEGNGPGQDGSSFPDFDREPDSASGGYGTDALGAAADMFEKIPELPAVNPQKILWFAAIAGLLMLVLYLLVRNFTGGPSSSAARKFGRSFQSAKISSPKDLVEAVDYFIVQKFGTRSQWWNAKHAQDVLCTGAPGYSAKISDLLQDYVQARYTRSDVTLSPAEQLKYKKTLQELAKEVSIEPQSTADASQDEG